MRVLLRSIKTGLYYQEASKWTPDQADALDFETTTRAVELAFASRLDNVEMLLRGVDPQFDLILPIKGPRPEADPSPASPRPHVNSQGPANDRAENK